MAEPVKLTQYGFKWKETEVIRVCSHKGHLILDIVTPREITYLRITPTGLIRLTKVHKRECNK